VVGWLEPYKPAPVPREPEVHIAKMMLPQRPVRLPPDRRMRVRVDRYELPQRALADLTFAEVELVLPARLRPRDRVIATGPGGLDVPWEPHPGLPALLIPGPAARQIHQKQRWRFEHHLVPECVGLPYSPEALAEAAWATLAKVQDLRTLVDALALATEAVDAAGYGSPFEVRFLASMQLPPSIEREVRLGWSPRHPLLDARCLRWIIAELCVALATGRRPRPPAMGDEAKQVARAFLPLSSGSGITPFREVLRAVWFLHAGYEIARVGDVAADHRDLQVLAMTAAYAAGTPLFGDPEERIVHAVGLWGLDDDDLHLREGGVAPGEFRDAFERRSGLDVRRFLTILGVAQMAVQSDRLGVAGASRALGTVLRALPERDRERFVALVRAELTQSPKQLGEGILKEMRRYDNPYRGLGSVPRYAPEAMRDRPVLDTGRALRPLGSYLLLDGAVRLPAVLFGRQKQLKRRQVGELVGHLFEAHMQHRVARVKPRFWVAGEQEISRVAEPDERRPDAIIGSGGRRYLAVEFCSSRLQTGVLSANRRSVEKTVEEHLKKREQASSLADHARRFIRQLRGSDLITSVVPLLVVDEPLQVNPAFEEVIAQRAPGVNPRFVCSADEFQMLLELGVSGWDIVDLVERWQAVGHGQMLGTVLTRQVELTPVDARRSHRFAELVVSVIEDQAA
jgi:hypothetical protein